MYGWDEQQGTAQYSQPKVLAKTSLIDMTSWIIHHDDVGCRRGRDSTASEQNDGSHSDEPQMKDVHV
jgi:hypothetical protein